MKFPTLYRLSFYIMLVFATLVLSVDASDIPYALVFPVVVGIAAVVAFLTVDRNRSLTLADLPLNLLAIASFPLAAVEYLFTDANILLLALGHWLVYLQLILMFRPKSVIEDWELFLLGLVQVLVGAVVSQSDSVGIMLFVWAILALWVLGLFSLERDALRAAGNGVRLTPAALTDGDAELYPGLLTFPFLVSALRVTLTTMALGGVIFLAMPRRPGMARTRGVEAGTQHMTGFDDEVQLGQLGEILESDNVVMSVELYNGQGARVEPEGEPLWRGATMARYENGRWFKQGKTSVLFPTRKGEPPRDPNRPQGEIRQVFKLEANDSRVLFALRPILDSLGPRRNGPDLNGVDGTISRAEVRNGTYDYEVISSRDPELPQPGEKRPGPQTIRRSLLSVPNASQARLRAIAEHVIETTLSPEQRRSDRARAFALMLYLRQSGEFSYTLKLEVADPTLDPVVDFLVNRKSGHCEYFASALALLLRSVDIPTRIVHGFKGGDWNELAQILYVRQKHAHSWVEAYLGDDGSSEHRPLWLTLDPTPANARDESVARVGGFRGHFRQLTDLIRYIWVFYIVGYNTDRQNRLIYEPLSALVSEAQRGFAMMGEEFRRDYAGLLRLLHFESTRSLVSPRGFTVSFLGLLIMLGLYRGARWLLGALMRWLSGQGVKSTALSAGAIHYRRLALLLSDCGLERPPAETQDEFARRATVYLTARGSNTEAVADVPRLVVDAFYRARFGHLDLSQTALSHLDARLDALEANLRASHA